MAYDKDRLRDYIEVNVRIIKFYERYPDGSLQSEVTEATDKRVTVKAWAYRTADDQRPGIGHSWLEIPGATSFTRGSELENAETSAWGRALAALGFEVKRGIASREEVENKSNDDFLKVAKPQSAGTQPAGSPPAEPASAAPSDVEAQLLSEEQRDAIYAKFQEYETLTGESALADDAIHRFGGVAAWKAEDYDRRYKALCRAVDKAREARQS